MKNIIDLVKRLWFVWFMPLAVIALIITIKVS
jgi:hypothetical protein